MSGRGNPPPEPTAGDIDVVMHGFRPASSGNGKVYAPPTSFATGRVRFWIGTSRNGGIRACVFRYTHGHQPLYEINDASSERTAVAELIRWARNHPEPEDGSIVLPDEEAGSAVRVRRFRTQFRSTRSGNGFTYEPEGGVGDWEVRFWVAHERVPDRTPATVYRRPTAGGSAQRRTYYFRTSQDAYAAMLSWADRRGWSQLSDFPANSRTVHNEPARTPKKRTARRDRSRSPESRSTSTGGSIDWSPATGNPSLDWNGSTEVDDWEPGDWERHYDRE